MRAVTGVLAAAALATCLVAPFLYLWGSVTFDEYKAVLLAGSVGWFFFATLWVAGNKGSA